MTITFPSWLLWVIGIPLGLLILIFAVFGAYMFWTFKDGIF